MPYGDVYRGQATPHAAVYGSPPLFTTPGQFLPQSARDGQQPPMVPGVPSMPANSDPFFAPPSDTNRFPQPVEGMALPVEGVPLPNGVTQSILEAKVRLESAEQELKTLKAQFEAGQIPSRELQRAEAERKLAEAAFEMAKQQYDLLLKIRKIDVQMAAEAMTAAQIAVNTRVRLVGDRQDPVFDADMRNAQANLAQMKLNYARARAMLEAIEKQGDVQDPEPTPEAQPKR